MRVERAFAFFGLPILQAEIALTSDLDTRTIGPDLNPIEENKGEDRYDEPECNSSRNRSHRGEDQNLDADLAAARENSKALVEQYQAQSADALKTLGIVDGPHKERKPRSQEAILVGAAARSIRQSVKGGEKNANTILAAALAAAEKAAKKKLNLAEVPADVKQKIEERVKGLSAKK